MPRGGKREGAGRPAGSRDLVERKKIIAIGDLARAHTKLALDTLVQIAAGGESEAARVSAANALLDRGYGKPSQTMLHGEDPDNPLPMSIPVTFVKPDA